MFSNKFCVHFFLSLPVKMVCIVKVYSPQISVLLEIFYFKRPRNINKWRKIIFQETTLNIR